MSDPSIPPVTREALEWLYRDMGTVLTVFARQSLHSSDEQQQIRRVTDWRTKVGLVLDALAAAPVAPSPQLQEQAQDTRVDGPPRPGEPCTADSDNLAHGLVRNLLSRLPYPDRLPCPEIGVEEDGDLCFDWNEPNGIVSASLTEQGWVLWSAVVGEWKGYGRFQLPMWNDTFNEALTRLGTSRGDQTA